MPWYDVFAGFYDHSVEKVYRPYRERAVAALGRAPGANVLDLACGTGPNFETLVRAVGPSGVVLGLDFSEGMLRRAKRRVEKAGIQVQTLQRDARGLTRAQLEHEFGGSGRLDAVMMGRPYLVVARKPADHHHFSDGGKP